MSNSGGADPSLTTLARQHTTTIGVGAGTLAVSVLVLIASIIVLVFLFKAKAEIETTLDDVKQTAASLRRLTKRVEDSPTAKVALESPIASALLQTGLKQLGSKLRL